MQRLIAQLNLGKFGALIRLLLSVVVLFAAFSLSGCEAGVYHTVKPGQNLYRIGRTYGVDEADLARINLIRDPTQIKVGTKIYIPGADHVLSVPVVKKTTTKAAKIKSPVKKKPVVKKTVSAKKKPTSKTVVKKTTPVKKPVSKVQPTKTKATSVKKLTWPLRGKIVRSFSTKALAGRGKGIEIAVRSGSAVVAAEAGKVIYSGDGVNGYGYLTILQHENDLFTVYGFNQRNYVRQGDFVSKGEKIALSGVPPAGGQPRLHFEVRKGKQAVNPLNYLP